MQIRGDKRRRPLKWRTHAAPRRVIRPKGKEKSLKRKEEEEEEKKRNKRTPRAGSGRTISRSAKPRGSFRSIEQILLESSITKANGSAGDASSAVGHADRGRSREQDLAKPEAYGCDPGPALLLAGDRRKHLGAPCLTSADVARSGNVALESTCTLRFSRGLIEKNLIVKILSASFSFFVFFFLHAPLLHVSFSRNMT